jgi:ribosomal protein L40E
MNAEFTAVIQQLIAEQGKEVLFSIQKCKAFLSDYTRGGHKRETRLLLQAIEADATKELADAKDLAICKQKIARDLRDDFFINEVAAMDVVDMLAFVLRGDMAEMSAHNPEKSATNKSTFMHPMLEEDIVSRSLEIWICGRCNTSNSFERDFCKKCGKEFNPPITKPKKDNFIKIRPALWEMIRK